MTPILVGFLSNRAYIGVAACTLACVALVLLRGVDISLFDSSVAYPAGILALYLGVSIACWTLGETIYVRPAALRPTLLLRTCRLVFVMVLLTVLIVVADQWSSHDLGSLGASSASPATVVAVMYSCTMMAATMRHDLFWLPGALIVALAMLVSPGSGMTLLDHLTLHLNTPLLVLMGLGASAYYVFRGCFAR